jgi:hypothetical protein
MLSIGKRGYSFPGWHNRFGQGRQRIGNGEDWRQVVVICDDALVRNSRSPMAINGKAGLAEYRIDSNPCVWQISRTIETPARRATALNVRRGRRRNS